MTLHLIQGMDDQSDHATIVLLIIHCVRLHLSLVTDAWCCTWPDKSVKYGICPALCISSLFTKECALDQT